MDQKRPIKLLTPAQIARAAAERARTRRLALGITQEDAAARAGISTPTLKRFEKNGRMGFDSVIRLGVALDAIDGFDQLFAAKTTFASLEDVLAPGKPVRQRAPRKPA